MCKLACTSPIISLARDKAIACLPQGRCLASPQSKERDSLPEAGTQARADYLLGRGALLSVPRLGVLDKEPFLAPSSRGSRTELGPIPLLFRVAARGKK